MLSIVTCSINPIYLKQLSINIAETIGIPFEHLTLDNRNTTMGICEVYNQLATKAQFSYLLFLHEDILFVTRDWGKQLIELFRSDDCPEVIGVAGSNYKSRAFSGWSTSIKAFDTVNIIHNINGITEKAPTLKGDINKLYPAVCIDGIFIACTKAVWSEIKFNEKQLKGFHFYDLDFSLRASEMFKVFITQKITMIHITKGGNFADKWVKEAIHFHSYMKDRLPKPLKIENQQKTEQTIVLFWLNFLKDQKVSFSNRMTWLTKQKIPFKWQMVYPIIRFLFYYKLRLKSLHVAIKNSRTK